MLSFFFKLSVKFDAECRAARLRVRTAEKIVRIPRNSIHS